MKLIKILIMELIIGLILLNFYYSRSMKISRNKIDYFYTIYKAIENEEFFFAMIKNHTIILKNENGKIVKEKEIDFLENKKIRYNEIRKKTV